MKVVGLIPCRYGSTRLPGKALADIHGKPMMWHVYQQSEKCRKVNKVYIATDDYRIAEVCEKLELNFLMTKDDHATGTDRVAECVNQIDADIYVNIQGDEPMIEPTAIDGVIDALKCNSSPHIMASNAYVPIKNASDVIDTNNVKVVLRVDGTALFYSRHPIPYPKGMATKYLRQLGLYAFKKNGLQLFSEFEPGPLERSENVEMLRFLERGYKIQMVQVRDDSIPVDTEADLERMREMMAGL